MRSEWWEHVGWWRNSLTADKLKIKESVPGNLQREAAKITFLKKFYPDTHNTPGGTRKLRRESSAKPSRMIVLDGKACEPIIKIANLFPPKRKADSKQQFLEYSSPTKKVKTNFSLTFNYWKTLGLSNTERSDISASQTGGGTDFGGI